MPDAHLVSLVLWAQTTGSGSSGALLTFALYTLVVLGLAWASNRLLAGRSFLSEYFLGSRSLGMWAFALTFAATSASGGSFTGFPSKVYTHGWVLAVWIGSYMVVPICTMGLLGKRINQVARKSGAITVPDVLRDRFESATLGLLATLLIVFFMSFNLVAQFKAGALILRTLLGDVPLFNDAAAVVAGWTAASPALTEAGPAYLLALTGFAFAVIVYTTYGGFHAVVWTDVLQGFVMVAGVMIMLPLALNQSGGLPHVTDSMRQMTPPLLGTAEIARTGPTSERLLIPAGALVAVDEHEPRSVPTESEVAAAMRIVRLGRNVAFEAGVSSVGGVPALEWTTPTETLRAVDDWARQPELWQAAVARQVALEPYAYGAGQQGVYVSGPGPDPYAASGFLPLSLAVSFFFMWAISGAGQPSNMVRLMAFNRSQTLRRAIFTVSIYYSLIYIPLVIIFCCARVILPGMEQDSDRIMPAMAVTLTSVAGVAWLGGLLIAAPFAAVMSTVDSFLLMISSALVRDVYQRNINPQAKEQTIRRLSYAVTAVVGCGAVLGAINPPHFLQDIIVYTGSGLAACFLAPIALALYWPRANTAGAVAGMAGGFAAHLALYVVGRWLYGAFRPYSPAGIDPIIWGLAASLIITLAVTLATAPPPAHLVRRYFFRQP